MNFLSVSHNTMALNGDYMFFDAADYHMPYLMIWRSSKFTLDGTQYNSVGQYMTYRKGLAAQISAQRLAHIMRETNQYLMQDYYENIEETDEWCRTRFALIRRALYTSITQIPYHRYQFLLIPQNTYFVYCDDDTYWGIGCDSSDDFKRYDTRQWGKNQLGQLVTQIHRRLWREKNKRRDRFRVKSAALDDRLYTADYPNAPIA